MLAVVFIKFLEHKLTKMYKINKKNSLVTPLQDFSGKGFFMIGVV